MLKMRAAGGALTDCNRSYLFHFIDLVLFPCKVNVEGFFRLCSVLMCVVIIY